MLMTDEILKCIVLFTDNGPVRRNPGNFIQFIHYNYL